MKCPQCGGERFSVVDKRVMPWKIALQLRWPGNGFWRRRQCVDCQHVFDTREYIWPPPPKSSTALNR